MKEAQPPKDNPDDGKAPRRDGPLQRDKEGFPILAPGEDTMAIMGGKARWVSPQCTMDRIANMVNQLNAPVADTTGSPASTMSTCSGRSVDSGAA